MDDVGEARNFKSLVGECAVILATLLSCDMLLCHNSLYLNKGSSFEASNIYVKLSFTAEGQTPGKVDNRKTQD